MIASSSKRRLPLRLFEAGEEDARGLIDREGALHEVAIL
jgi:hypothetical protein